MAHYAYVLSVSRLKFAMSLGFLPQELRKQQLVEISYRLYFDQSLPSNSDDKASFFDYGTLSDALREFAQQSHYNLIEFAAMELFRYLRQLIDAKGGEAAKLWFQLNKIDAPVEGLVGGASFVHSDLPADATYIPSVLQ